MRIRLYGLLFFCGLLGVVLGVLSAGKAGAVVCSCASAVEAGSAAGLVVGVLEVCLCVWAGISSASVWVDGSSGTTSSWIGAAGVESMP